MYNTNINRLGDKMQTWKSDKEFSLKFESCYDTIYKDVFGKNIEIYRNHEYVSIEGDRQDQVYHIDTQLDTSFGRITTQEKTLRHCFSKFNTFTIEFLNNRFDGTKGEFFHCTAAYYLHSYADEAEINLKKWCIIDMNQFRLACRTNLNWFSQVRDDNNSKANFMWIKYDNIPQNCFLTKNW